MKVYKLKIFATLLLLMAATINLWSQEPVGNVPFSQRMEQTIKGDLTIISNAVLGRVENPNGSYNGSGNNNGRNQTFIDIDGDPSTFQSSSATYDDPGTCSQITYAGLYWSAVYPIINSEIADNQLDGYPLPDPRPDFREIKFKTPGGAYVDITPTSGSYATQVIFDGYRNTPTNPSNRVIKDVPYVAHADVTELVQGAATPFGEYTIANVKAFTGTRGSGAAAGWILVIVHENPLESRKFIGTFDGFSQITGTFAQDYIVNGFSTIPTGPVRARYGVGTLEGDLNITNDQLQVKADLTPTVFTTLSNATNPERNFFNSSISRDGAHVTSRVPASQNNLGFDSDIFLINNPLNTVIPNGETGATFKTRTSGDSYSVFVNTFAIEIIEPELFVTKRVYDLGGTDITGGGVNLGQEIWYELEIQNIGNDDAINTYILDDLPINVDYIAGTEIAPPGVATSYNAGLRQLRFDIDPSLVQINDASFTIRFKVQVVDGCAGLRDACSNLIENTATSYYQGAINSGTIESDPSYYGIDGCNFGIAGSSNFLIDLDDCDFVREEVLCGNSLEISAGDGFDSYTWTDQDGNVVGNTQTITVTAPGTYTCNKVAPAPCTSFDETVIVSLFADITNPILPYADNIRTCPINGAPLPEIILCGSEDSQLLELDLEDAVSITWEQLDAASCAATPDENCPNTDTACTWDEVANGSNYTANIAGEFRVNIELQNGCFRTFYFNVLQNTIDPDLVLIEPIVCGNTGSIEVQNVPSSGYEYSLSPSGPWQTSTLFTGLTAEGNYTVYVRAIDPLAGACVFTASVDVPEYGADFNVITNDIQCAGDQGSIIIQVTDAQPPYSYTITDGGSYSDTVTTTQSTYTFDNLNPGTYTITVTARDGDCSFTSTETIDVLSTIDMQAVVLQHISCEDGIIEVTASGGAAPYNYAISSVNGVPVNPSAYVFQTENTFIFVPGEEGTYEFIVADQNNCTAESSAVTINLEDPVAYTIDTTDPTCFGANDGAITFTISGDTYGNTLTYSIDGGLTFQSSATFNGLTAGTYNTVFRTTKGGVICEYTDQVILVDPSPITADIDLIQDYTCIDTASIQAINVSGGTPGYTYSIDGLTYVASNVFTGLINGTYSIFVRDSNGCVFETVEIVIDALNEPTDIDFTSTALLCPALTADVTLTVIDGNPSFLYEIIAPITVNNGTNNVFTGLSAGTYTFQVTDAKSCTYQETYTIDALVPITVNAQAGTNVSCVGNADGEAVFTVANYATSYDYTVSGPVTFSATGETATSVSLTGLLAGTYTVGITDTSTNCTATDTFVIEEPTTALAVDSIDLIDISCSPSGNVAGGATINVIGGWGSNSYTLVFPDGTTTVGPQSNNTFSGLTQSGTYTITVVDANGCTIIDTFDLLDPVPPTLTLTPDTLCYLPGTGVTVTATVSAGGEAPFQYSLDGGAFQNGNVFAGLTPGVHTVTVVDAKNCTDTQTITVAQALTASAQLQKNIDCSASPEAQITVTANGGTPAYSFAVSINGAAYTGIPATMPYQTSVVGTFQFQITDANGCTVTTGVVNTTNPDPPVATHTTTEPNCFGNADGQVAITVDPSVGVAPYEINFNGGGFSAQTLYAGLAAGTYSYVVRDANECTTTYSFTLGEPDPITATITPMPITCGAMGNENGSIEITGVTGGSGTYTYYLYKNGILDTNTSTANPSGPTTADNIIFDDLPFGNYYVTIIDDQGCEYEFGPFLIASPPDDLDLAAVTSGTCAAGVSIDISVVNGVGAFQIRVLNSPANNTFVPMNGLPSSSGPAPERNHQFSGLQFGVSYIVEVLDTSTNCTYIEQLAPEPPLTAIDLTLTETDVSCNAAGDGILAFTVAATTYTGNQLNWTIFEDFTGATITSGSSGPVLNPATDDYSETITGLAPGDYYIVIEETDPSSTLCETAQTFRITEPTPVNLNLSSTIPANCNIGAQVSVIASGGIAPYTYAFVVDGGTPLATDYSTANAATLDPSISLDWDVYALDFNGCPVMIDLTITEDPDPTVTAPTFADDQCTSTGSSYTFTVTGTGVAPLRYSIDGVSFVGSGNAHTFTVTTDGTYTITIRDGNGCTAIDTIDIYPPLELSGTVTAQPSCANDDGVITVSGLGGAGAYTFVLLDAASNPTGYAINASNEFTGLPFGDYIVEITDTLTSCTETFPITLEEPTLPVLNPSTLVDVSCNGASDGSIQANLDTTTADNPTYTYILYDSVSTIIAGPQSSPLFQGLPSGDYIVEVTSGRQCIASEMVTIDEPSVLQISALATDFACAADNTVNTATITVSVTNDTTGNPSGTAPYLYSIDGVSYQSSNTFEVVDTGMVQNRTLYVQDANGCIATTSVTILPLPTITAVTVTQNVAITCVNPEEVLITVTGGSGEFLYELLPSGPAQGPVTSNTAVFTLATPGTYTFRVTDVQTGCYTTTEPYTVAPYDTIEAIATLETEISCYGALDGGLSLTVLQYTGNYDFTVSDSGGFVVQTGSSNTAANPLSITNLGAGSYTITVSGTDTPFCSTTTNSVLIDSPNDPFDIDVISINDLSCTPGNDAAIQVTASGGWGDYTFSINGGPFGTQNTFDGLGAGTYTIVARDSAGNYCELSQVIDIVEPNPIAASATATDVVCYGDSNGTVTATASGGQGAGTYTYLLNYPDGSTSAAQTTPVFTDLPSGTYSVTVNDDLNCGLTTNPVTINDPAEVLVAVELTQDMSCLIDATITVTASNGVAPYTYSIDGINFSTNNVFTNLVSGDYQFYAMDANGCISNVSNPIVIDPIEELNLDLDLSNAIINCFSEENGAVFAEALGGLGNYMYELLDASNTVIVGPQDIGYFNNLGPGTFTIRVVSDDCETVSDPFTITEPPLLEVDFEVQSITCAGEQDGRITVMVEGGTPAILYSLDQFAYTNNNTFENLTAGVYTIFVQDSNGCAQEFDITVEEPLEIEATSAILSEEVCLGEGLNSLMVEIEGGTQPYEISIDAINFFEITGNTYVFEELEGGLAYPVFVRDANGCDTIVTPLTFDAPIDITADYEVAYQCDGLNTLTVTNVNEDLVADVMYVLDGQQAQLSNVFENLADGVHTVEVQHVTTGCTYLITDIVIEAPLPPVIAGVNEVDLNTYQIVVEDGVMPYTYYLNGALLNSNEFVITESGVYLVRVVDDLGCEALFEIMLEFIDINIPNYFTPNGDTTNDYWKPDNFDRFPKAKAIIFDRYGRVLDEFRVEEPGWDGLYQDKLMPAGDYWYAIELNDDQNRVLKGHFTLYRR